MQARLDEFSALDTKIVVLSFVQPDRLRQYLALHSWQVPVLADPDRAAYRAFGLARAGWPQLLSPRVIVRYLGLLLRGRRLRSPQEDVHQLGGDFVIDRLGRVVYSYRSHDPADRPSVDDLLSAVKGVTASDH